jgi:hypothetical protein
MLSRDEINWAKRTTIAVTAGRYYLPDATGTLGTTEVEAALRGFWGIERSGNVQLGWRLFPALSVARDFDRNAGTIVHTGIGTQVGPDAGLSVFVNGEVAFSDLPGASGSPRDFGYHGADVQVGADRDFTLWQRRHLSTRIAWDLESPDARIGKRLGVLRIRVKLRGPVYTIR